MNVIDLDDGTFGVKKALLSPKYYETYPEHTRNTLDVDGVNYVVLPAEAIIDDIDVLTMPHSMDTYNYPMGYGRKPYAHQIYTARFLVNNFNSDGRGAHVHNSMGCVDADTEFLTPQGWKRIADYTDGDMVMQVNPNTLEGDYTLPTAYIKKPEKVMYNLHTQTGIDMVLSREHRNILFRYEGGELKHKVFSTEELISNFKEIHSNRYRFARGIFGKGGTGINLTNDELRLMVAIMADGHFYAQQNNNNPNNTSNSYWCKIKLAKQRKIDRLKMLLDNCGISYKKNTVKRDNSMKDNHSDLLYFCFNAPHNNKKFTQDYYNCSLEQLKIILDELPHWDGHFQKSTKNTVYYSKNKSDVDFISYAVTILGGNASIRQRLRKSPASNKDCVNYELVWGGTRGILEGRGFKPDNITTYTQHDGFKYCFTVPQTFWLARRNGRAFVTGNTGKSLSCLWAVDFLLQQQLIKKVLIVAPKVVMRSAWLKEITNELIHIPTALKVGKHKLRKTDAQIDIINHDGITSILKKHQRKVSNRVFYDFSEVDEEYDLIIYDEATALKNAMAERSKIFGKWFDYLHQRYKTKLWLLTGTPVAQSPMDAYGLIKLISPTSVPHSIKIWKEATMFPVDKMGFKWLVKPDAVKLCASKLVPSIRFEIKDCTDLPEHQMIFIPVEKTKQQEALFKEMSNDYIATIDDNNQISAVNGAAKLSKLLQLLSGCVYDTEKKTHLVDASNKLEATIELIDALPDEQPAVIFCDFVHVQEYLLRELSKKYKTVEVINGSTPALERSAICERVLRCETKVVIAHTVTTALGVDFTSTNMLIYYTPTQRNELYLQSLDRIRRLSSVGKFSSFLIYHLVADKLEQRIFEGLHQRGITQQEILNLARQELLND